MPPKADKQKKQQSLELDENAQRQLNESIRLQQYAYDSQMVAVARPADTAASEERLPARADGKEVIKKGSLRKNRYLMNVSAKLAATVAGKLGSLAALDTRNPVMYIEFPEGRLKFKGTIFFPKNKYMSLRFKGKEEVLIEDIFESMIVFSEHFWVGRKEENPDERPMPMPSTLQQASEEFGEAPSASQMPTKQGTQNATSQASQGASQGTLRTSQRASKRPRYIDVDSSEDEIDSVEDKEDVASDPEESSPEAVSEGKEDNRDPDERKPAAGQTKGTLLTYLQSQKAAKGTSAHKAQLAKKATPKQSVPGGKGKSAKKAKRVVDTSESSEDGRIDSDADSDAAEDASQRRSQPSRAARSTSVMPIILEDDETDAPPDEGYATSDDSDFNA